MTLDLGKAVLCHLSFLTYVRQLGKVMSNCIHGVKYAGLLYADDVCLMMSNEEDMKLIMEKVNECVVEFGLKVNEKKSKVVCINSEVGRRRWMMEDCCIGVVEEYKYLGITVEGGKHERLNEINKLTDRNGKICSRAIREQLCDWKGRMDDTLIRYNIRFTTTDIPSTINTYNTELQMVTVHINNTKHITIANIYIPPRDSTSTHYKTADTDIQHCIQHIINIPHSVLAGDVNAHSTLWHSYTNE